ncbi:MAG: hypothetical protein ACXWEY_13950 [Bacteroidia bacterium]
MQQRKRLPANKPQERAILAMAFKAMLFLVWGRGTGKSFFLAWFMKEVVRRMPGSKWTFLGPTYAKLLFDILPGIVGALERLGYYKDVHFFVGKKPPRKWGWNEPFEPPMSYDYSIIFYHPKRCTVFQMASQDRDGNSRGVNTDGVIIDEGLLINKEKLEKNLLPTNRGNKDRFGHDPLHHGFICCTSMPFTQEGQWILDKQLEALADKSIYYDEANCFENIANVGLQYIRDQRKLMTPLSFEIEMLNIRKTQIEGGFYPVFNDVVHCYDDSYDYAVIDAIDFDLVKKVVPDSRYDADCDAERALEIAVDWGASINPMVICQEHQGKDAAVIRFLNGLFVLSPDILDDLAKKFCNYYRYHRCKDVLFWYDRNGNSKHANSRLTNAEQFEKILKENGWNVYKMTRGLDPSHDDKYMFLNKLLRETERGLPKIRINKNNCKELIISIQQAPVKEGRSGVEKDKKNEKNKNFPQQHATHFSDAFDIILYGKYRRLIDVNEYFVDNSFF